MKATILRASTVEPKSPGSFAYRIVLAQQENEVCPFVVWMQVFPEQEGRPPYFVQGDYYRENEADQAHERFQQRRDRSLLFEDFNHQESFATYAGLPF